MPERRPYQPTHCHLRRIVTFVVVFSRVAVPTRHTMSLSGCPAIHEGDQSTADENWIARKNTVMFVELFHFDSSARSQTPRKPLKLEKRKIVYWLSKNL